MKTFIRILTIVIIFSSVSYAQSLNLRLSTYFYGWERGDSINSDVKTAHMRGYQNVLLELKQKQWSFNTLIQTEEDVFHKIDGGFNYRFYNLYLTGSNLWNAVDVKLGRQYLFAGVGKGPVDGLNLKVKAGKYKEYQFSAYGGSLVPYNYDFRNYPDVGDNYMFGGMFGYYGVRGMTAIVSYTNRHRKPQPYTALRLDSLMNTREVTIDIDSPADQLIGLDLNYSYLNKHSFYAKAYYDLNNKVFYRGEFNAGVDLTNGLRLTAMYQYREPQISYNTIFWTFEHRHFQEVGGSIDYTTSDGINLSAGVSDVIYTDDNSLKIQAGVSGSSFSLAYVKYTGYAGESDGAFGYVSFPLLRPTLSANVNLNYSTYSIGDFSSVREGAFSAMLGLVYRPSTQFSVDVQGQLITNRIYNYDSRILVGLNYWLFTKF